MDAIQQFIQHNNLQQLLLAWGGRLLAAIAIFVVGRWAARLATAWTARAIARKADPTLVDFGTNLFYAVLLAAVIIAALDQLGVRTTSLLALLGAAGLAVGLAMKDSLSNFASGVMLIAFRPFRVGDFVQLAGEMGTVENVRIFHTLLKTPNGQALWIPNGNITNGNITNFSSKPTRRVDLTVGVSYDDDLRKVRRVLEDILKAESRVLAEPAPQILVTALADSSVNVTVRPWTKSEDWWATTCDLTEKIKLTFDEQGITIPYPQRDVHHYHEEGPEDEANTNKENAT